jgi:uncharacterized protein (TIGR02246 family)
MHSTSYKKGSNTMYRLKRIGFSAYAFAAVFLLAIAAWPSAARALDCVPVTEDAIAKLFVVWNEALKTGKADNVVALYTSDAVLLPTVKNGPLIGHAAIRKYFEEDFLPNEPSGAIDGAHNIRIGCNTAFDAGLYTFTYGKKPNDPTHARYTYVYRYVGGTWLIAHHHSSKQPN